MDKSFDDKNKEYNFGDAVTVNVQSIGDLSVNNSINHEQSINNTNQLIGLMMLNSLNTTEEPPLLCDWLQRLRTKGYPKMYLKRYIFIQDGHLTC